MKAEWTNSDSLTTSQTTKAILVIDMPKACADGCPVMCRARGINHRPTWCPLRPLPQKKDVNLPNDRVWSKDEIMAYTHGISVGYNECLDDLGETE